MSASVFEQRAERGRGDAGVAEYLTSSFGCIIDASRKLLVFRIRNSSLTSPSSFERQKPTLVPLALADRSLSELLFSMACLVLWLS